MSLSQAVDKEAVNRGILENATRSRNSYQRINDRATVAVNNAVNGAVWIRFADWFR